MDSALVESTEPTARPAKRRVWPWIILLAIGAVGARYIYPRVNSNAAPVAVGAKKGRGAAPARLAPIVAAAARKGDMPVYLNGLGSVAAFNSVIVRTRHYRPGRGSAGPDKDTP